MNPDRRAAAPRRRSAAGEDAPGACPPRLTLYSRGCCHLCHEMREALEALGRLERFELAVLDIDDDPALQARFGRDVPVLAHGDREIARHRLDAAIVRAYLAGIG